jgi:hypothetical protein
LPHGHALIFLPLKIKIDYLVYCIRRFTSRESRQISANQKESKMTPKEKEIKVRLAELDHEFAELCYKRALATGTATSREELDSKKFQYEKAKLLVELAKAQE